VGRANGKLPPGPRAPAAIQAVRYARDPIGFFVGLTRRYGDAFTVSFPYFGKIVYAAHPDLVKQVFTGDPAVFHAGEANATVLEPALGPHSVLTLDEKPHLRQRRLLLPPFHGDAIGRYGGLIREIAERDVESWPLGTPFPLRPHTQGITLAVILRAVFGVSDEQRFRRATKLVDEFGRSADLPTKIPWLRRDLGRWSPWARFVRARSALDEFIYEEIAARRAEKGEGEDVLSLLIAARHEDGSPMNDQELRDELVTVVGAGHETTATALAWAFERLLRNPRVLSELRRSIERGEEDYLNATIKETLRIRPVIVDVARKLTAPARIGRFELPAGTFVLPAIAALHFRPDLFGDPAEFRPERFLEDNAEHYSWIPFGGGVRRCIGASFAEFEMRIVLRTILERVELRAADPRPERPRARNITLAPAKETRVVLERRLPRRASTVTAADAAVAAAG
jgi:cytochrome P450